MRVTIVRDGETSTVEVGDDLGTVTVGGRSYPVKVVSAARSRVELEVAGDRVAVDGWPDRYPTPPTTVEVDGERWTVSVDLSGTAPPARPPTSAAVPATAGVSGPPTGPGGSGTAVLPPMPGKVVELKVREGERVHRGQLLLVLEAMKMRNEITSPIDGTVRRLTVAPGENVRAREPMLFVVPE